MLANEKVQSPFCRRLVSLCVVWGGAVGGEDCPRMRWMWVNAEQSLRVEINSLCCSFPGADGLPAGAQPLASHWGKQFVRLLILVLWRNA